MAQFEIVTRFKDGNIKLPIRKTSGAAGYDFFVAEDTIIPPYMILMDNLICDRMIGDSIDNEAEAVETPITLDDLANQTKLSECRPTLVPTGIKAKLNKGTYLQLSVRSSCPLKYWLVLGNGVGIIDQDQFNNISNEGEIFFQLINLSPFPIMLKKGDCIGQGTILPYLTAEDDNSGGERVGGFGSSDAQ